MIASHKNVMEGSRGYSESYLLPQDFINKKFFVSYHAED